MAQPLLSNQEYLDAFVKTAQYLASLTTQQELWIELQQLVSKFFGADVVGFIEQGKGGDIGRHWGFNDVVSSEKILTKDVRELINDVLESGFLSSKIVHTPEAYSIVLLPIIQENWPKRVMLVGHNIPDPLPRELLNVYLGVAGLVSTTSTRWSSERELKNYRLHLEELVKIRTKELSEANKKLERDRIILNSVGEGIFVVDLQGHITFANPAAQEKCGYQLEELLGRPMHDLIHYVKGKGSSLPWEECPLNDTIKDGKVRRIPEDVFWNKEEQPFPVEYVTTALREDSELKGAVTIFRDITKRKEAEEALRSVSRYTRSLIEVSPDPLVTISRDGKIMDVNQATEKATGVSREELIGQDFANYFTEPEKAREGYQQVFSQGMVHDYPLAIRHTSGSTTPVLYNASVYRDEFGEIQGVFAAARDITKRKEAEEALRSVSLYSRSLIEVSPDPLVTISRDGKIMDVNQATEKATGVSREELIGQDFANYFTKPEKAREGYQQVFSQGMVHDYPLAIRHTSGSTTLVLYNASIYRDESGEIKGVFAAARDITKLKQAEEALAFERQRFYDVLEMLPVYVALLTSDYHVVFANRTFRDRFGEYHGRRCYEFMFGRTEPCEICETYTVLKTLKPAAWEWSGPDNRDYEIHDYPFTDVDGSPLILEMGIDITERKLAEQALRYSEEKYRGLIETTNTGYVIIDLDGKVLDANLEYVRLTGHYGLNEIIGRSVLEWTIEQDREKNASEVKKCIQQGYVKNFEVIYEGEDGRSIPVEINATVITTSQGVKILSLVRDITDRKEAEEAIRQREEQLQQAQKMEAVGKLAGGIAHDFNNILTAISGQSELLLLDLPENTPQRLGVQEIQRAADRAASLTRQLLAFSRKEIIHPKVLELNGLIQNIYKMLRRLIPEDIHIVSIPGLNLGRVFADPGQIEQAIVNLAVNARDAMPQGGKLIIETANVDLEVKHCQRHKHLKPGPYVMLAVSDTGIGMDSKTQSRIFEPFFTTKGMGHGTGLGLSMVYGIVKQNNGYIWIYSEVDHGTTCKIYLPRTIEAGESVEAPQISSASFGGSETILLVEDEGMVREITRKILQKEGYEVLTASSGSEALLIGEQYKGSIQLILSDVLMPNMNGPETVGRLMTRHSEAKVLYMSGHTENSIVHHGVLDQGVTFIQKPFSRAALLRKVRELLDTFSDK